MIGQGLIVIRREPNQNELHAVDPWEMMYSLSKAGEGGDQGIDDWNQETLWIVRRDAWKPDDVVDDAEVEAIKDANACIEGEGLRYHPWASDIVHVIDLTEDKRI